MVRGISVLGIVVILAGIIVIVVNSVWEVVVVVSTHCPNCDKSYCNDVTKVLRMLR